MINNLQQPPSIHWASGLLQATSSHKDNGAISCGVQGKALQRAKQASIVKQGHHTISVSCPWNERPTWPQWDSGLFAGILEPSQPDTSADMRLTPAYTGYSESLSGHLSDFVKIWCVLIETKGKPLCVSPVIVSKQPLTYSHWDRTALTHTQKDSSKSTLWKSQY